MGLEKIILYGIFATGVGCSAHGNGDVKDSANRYTYSTVPEISSVNVEPGSIHYSEIDKEIRVEIYVANTVVNDVVVSCSLIREGSIYALPEPDIEIEPLGRPYTLFFDIRTVLDIPQGDESTAVNDYIVSCEAMNDGSVSESSIKPFSVLKDNNVPVIVNIEALPGTTGYDQSSSEGMPETVPITVYVDASDDRSPPSDIEGRYTMTVVRYNGLEETVTGELIYDAVLEKIVASIAFFYNSDFEERIIPGQYDISLKVSDSDGNVAAAETFGALADGNGPIVGLCSGTPTVDGSVSLSNRGSSAMITCNDIFEEGSKGGNNYGEHPVTVTVYTDGLYLLGNNVKMFNDGSSYDATGALISNQDGSFMFQLTVNANELPAKVYTAEIEICDFGNNCVKKSVYLQVEDELPPIITSAYVGATDGSQLYSPINASTTPVVVFYTTAYDETSAQDLLNAEVEITGCSDAVYSLSYDAGTARFESASVPTIDLRGHCKAYIAVADESDNESRPELIEFDVN